MDFEIPTINLIVILPLLIVIGWALLLMFVDLFLPEQRKHWLSWLSLVGLGAALVQTISLWGNEYATFQPAGGHAMLVADNFSHFLNVIFLLTGILTVLISAHYTSRAEQEMKGEYYMLLLLSLSGMMLMGMANDLILVFLALELLSIPLYILCGYARPRPESEESAMKYFLLGAFSSAFLVFGIALIYGATGSTALPDIWVNMDQSLTIGMAGVALLIVGFAFKVAAVPFHAWTPDVYEGAPTTVTAFMSVGAKVGGFAAMIRVFNEALPAIDDTWIPVVAVIAALTMIMGNVVAVAQDNIKRMLAYSSIAHAGFIMIAVATGESGVPAALFYMLAYLFTNLAVFAIVIALERNEGDGLNLEHYKGLAKRHPILALALAYLMLSLTGVPPTGGFSAKFFVFQAAIDADLIWLAIIGVVTSVVSGYFYLRIVYLMYMYDGEPVAETRPALNLVVAIGVLGTLVLGFFPGSWFELAQQAVLAGVQIAGG